MSTALHDVAAAGFIAAALYPDAISTSPTGAAIDMITADGPCFAIQQVGDLTEETSLTGMIEESANGTSGWSAIDGAAFVAVGTADNVQAITFRRSARYLRYVATLEGDTPSIDLAVLIGEQRKSL